MSILFLKLPFCLKTANTPSTKNFFLPRLFGCWGIVYWWWVSRSAWGMFKRLNNACFVAVVVAWRMRFAYAGERCSIIEKRLVRRAVLSAAVVPHSTNDQSNTQECTNDAASNGTAVAAAFLLCWSTAAGEGGQRRDNRVAGAGINQDGAAKGAVVALVIAVPGQGDGVALRLADERVASVGKLVARVIGTERVDGKLRVRAVVGGSRVVLREHGGFGLGWHLGAVALFGLVLRHDKRAARRLRHVHARAQHGRVDLCRARRTVGRAAKAHRHLFVGIHCQLVGGLFASESGCGAAFRKAFMLNGLPRGSHFTLAVFSKVVGEKSDAVKGVDRWRWRRRWWWRRRGGWSLARERRSGASVERTDASIA
eukprot:m.76314 g.76314  ORF g.76314 m.76314 type:complete len:368 (-) comp14507_c2_seq1:1136-2239(-)